MEDFRESEQLLSLPEVSMPEVYRKIVKEKAKNVLYGSNSKLKSEPKLNLF